MDGKLLLELFDQREQAYTETTTKIAAHLDFVLEAIVEVLNLDSKEISWESFDLQDSMFVFVGKVGLETKAARLITAAIPMKLVEQGKDAIVSFLKKEAKKNEAVEQHERNALQKVRQIIAQEEGEDEELIEGEEPLPEIKDPTTMLGETLYEYMKRNNRNKRTLH